MERGNLVLTRLDGQGIIIGNDVLVSVVESKNGRVKLRISAPKDVSVDRTEIREFKENARCEGKQ